MNILKLLPIFRMQKKNKYLDHYNLQKTMTGAPAKGGKSSASPGATN